MLPEALGFSPCFARPALSLETLGFRRSFTLQAIGFLGRGALCGRAGLRLGAQPVGLLPGVGSTRRLLRLAEAEEALEQAGLLLVRHRFSSGRQQHAAVVAGDGHVPHLPRWRSAASLTAVKSAARPTPPRSVRTVMRLPT